MPAHTAAGPSPTAQISELTCRHTLTPRDTSVRAAPRPSPACHSWQGMRNLAAAPVPERYGFGAGRRDKTSTQETTAGAPLGSLVLPGALRGARRAGAQQPAPPQARSPAHHSLRLFQTRAAQWAIRVSEGLCTSPTSLCPLRGDFPSRGDFRQDKNHRLIFHLLWFQLLGFWS